MTISLFRKYIKIKVRIGFNLLANAVAIKTNNTRVDEMEIMITNSTQCYIKQTMNNIPPLYLYTYYRLASDCFTVSILTKNQSQDSLPDKKFIA